jgi:hypothetical protein
MLHKDLLFLVLTGLIFIYYLSGFESDRAHYYFVVYPFIILAGVGALNNLFNKIHWKLKTPLWLAFLSVPFYFSILNAYTFYQKDTRLILYYWLQDRYLGVSRVFYTEDELRPLFEKLNIEGDLVGNDFDNFTHNSLMITDENTRSDLQLTGEIHNNLRKGPHLYLYKP